MFVVVLPVTNVCLPQLLSAPTRHLHLLSAGAPLAKELDPMQASLTAGQLYLPQRAGQHLVLHFAGLVHSANYLKRNNF
jgi:hypothetical protein